MSDPHEPRTTVPPTRPAMLPLRLPRAGAGTVVLSSAFDGAMKQLEEADARNVKSGTTPAFPAIILAAEDGSSWQVTVDAPSGSLRVTEIGR